MTEALKPGDEIFVNGKWLIVLSAEDYERLLEAAEADDMLIWCETCGAWIDRNDEAAAHIEDFHGRWKAATGNPRWGHLCRSHRVSEAVKAIRGRQEMERRLANERARRSSEGDA